MSVRYAELRDNGLFSQRGMLELARDLLGRYAPELMQAEYEKWSNVPSMNITSLHQVMDGTRLRIEYLATFSIIADKDTTMIMTMI